MTLAIQTVATLLDMALRDAGAPIVGVRIGNEADKATWFIEFTQGATQQQMDAALAFVAAFDPASQATLDAATARDASTFALSHQQKAMMLWTLRLVLGHNPTQQEIQTARTAMIQAYKDTA